MEVQSLRDPFAVHQPAQLSDLALEARFDGRSCVPLLANSLGGEFYTARHKLFQIDNITRVHDLCYEPLTKHIWGITRSDTADNYIFKIAREDCTPSTIALGGGAGANRGMACCYAKGYVWFALFSTPAGLIKLNPSNSCYTTYSMETGENAGTGVCAGRDHIYMTLYTDEGQIVKFNIEDNTHTSTTITGTKELYWCTFDGTYVWAVGKSTGGNVALVRFVPSDSSFTVYDLGSGSPHHVAFDGNFIWVACATSNVVIKFDIDAAAVDNQITIPPRLGSLYLLEFDGRAMWVGMYSGSFAWLLRMSPTSMAYEVITLTRSVPSELKNFHAMCFDGTHLWFSNWHDTCYVMKWSAYRESLGGGAPWILDGNQETVGQDQNRYVDTKGMNTSEAETQIPILSSYFIESMATNVLTNSANQPVGFALRKDGVLVNQIIVPAGETGQFSISIAEYFNPGDLLSVRVRGGGTMTGTISIGKVVLYTKQ